MSKLLSVCMIIYLHFTQHMKFTIIITIIINNTNCPLILSIANHKINKSQAVEDGTRLKNKIKRKINNKTIERKSEQFGHLDNLLS